MEQSRMNINLKAGAVITGLAIIFVSAFGWLLSGKFDGYDRQLQKQWQKLNRLERVICKVSPGDGL